MINSLTVVGISRIAERNPHAEIKLIGPLALRLRSSRAAMDAVGNVFDAFL